MNGEYIGGSCVGVLAPEFVCKIKNSHYCPCREFSQLSSRGVGRAGGQRKLDYEGESSMKVTLLYLFTHFVSIRIVPGIRHYLSA